jgi:sensor histidine kinase YesM
MIRDRRLSPELQAALLSTTGLWIFGYAVDAILRVTSGELPPASHLGLLERLHPALRWTLLLVFTVLVAFAHGLIEVSPQAILNPHGRVEDSGRVLISQPLLILYVTAFNVFLIVFVRAQRRAEEERRRLLAAELTAQRAQVTAQRAQLTALRLQINPHFLFNTLNTISGLVMTGRLAEAETTMARLADFLRTSLTHDPAADVTVDDELAAAEAYLQIEHARLGDRLRLEIDCASEVRRARVPNLILQPLVENAVKYGVAPRNGSVLLRVSAIAEGGQLVLGVRDQADEADPGAPVAGGTGLGLSNVRRRLDVLYGAAAGLSAGPAENGWRSIVRLPLSFSEQPSLSA